MPSLTCNRAICAAFFFSLFSLFTSFSFLVCFSLRVYFSAISIEFFSIDCLGQCASNCMWWQRQNIHSCKSSPVERWQYVALNEIPIIMPTKCFPRGNKNRTRKEHYRSSVWANEKENNNQQRQYIDFVCVIFSLYFCSSGNCWACIHPFLMR